MSVYRFTNWGEFRNVWGDFEYISGERGLSDGIGDTVRIMFYEKLLSNAFLFIGEVLFFFRSVIFVDDYVSFWGSPKISFPTLFTSTNLISLLSKFISYFNCSTFAISNALKVSIYSWITKQWCFNVLW